jgi:hypothetical protein
MLRESHTPEEGPKIAVAGHRGGALRGQHPWSSAESPSAARDLSPCATSTPQSTPNSGRLPAPRGRFGRKPKVPICRQSLRFGTAPSPFRIPVAVLLRALHSAQRGFYVRVRTNVRTAGNSHRAVAVC